MKAGGAAVAREHQLLAAYVTKSVNRITAARLVYLDGAAAASDFPLSNATTFLPGQEIEIQAGAGNAPVTLFKGIVVKQSLKVRDHTAPQLVVECRHRAVKLTVGRKSAYFLDQKDSELIGALLQAAGLPAEVQATPVKHQQQVQYASTDWDFLVARAEANGRMVLTNDDRVTVKAPALGGSPALTLQFGATVLELDAEMDARDQFGAVKSFTWDPAQQSVLEKEAADPGIAGPGNVAPADLAKVVGLAHYPLVHPAVAEEEAQAWADAAWLKSRLSKTSGRLKCEGVGTVNPGDLVAVAGVGKRFGGTVFVTGVRHDFDTVQGWKTHVHFGATDQWLAEEPRVTAPKAAALLPGINGLQIGVVVGNEDPDGEHRVRVRMPMVSGDSDGTWARVAALDAGAERGFFFRPEIGDEVVIGFLNDDPRHPVILGMLHSSAKAAPLKGSDENHEKLYQSRARLKLYFNDEKKVIELETPAGNKLTLSERDKAIRIVDQNGNKLEMTPDGIKLESAKAVEIRASMGLKVEAGTSLGLKGGTELKLESAASFSAKGANVKVEGSAAAEFTSSGATTVKGAILKLN